MVIHYHPIIIALLWDLAAITIVAYAVFYRRYRRSDLVLAYFAVNVGLFAVGVLIVQQTHIGVAFGFGLFAVLSIIRLRSEPITPEESAYYFIALVLGLLNGMQFKDLELIIILDVAIVGVMVLLDNRWVMPRAHRQMVTLDVVHPDLVSLRADLERRLGGKVGRMMVRQVDYVRDVTVVDVRFTYTRRKRRAPSPVSQTNWPFEQLRPAGLESP